MVGDGWHACQPPRRLKRGVICISPVQHDQISIIRVEYIASRLRIVKRAFSARLCIRLLIQILSRSILSTLTSSWLRLVFSSISSSRFPPYSLVLIWCSTTYVRTTEPSINDAPMVLLRIGCGRLLSIQLLPLNTERSFSHRHHVWFLPRLLSPITYIPRNFETSLNQKRRSEPVQNARAYLVKVHGRRAQIRTLLLDSVTPYSMPGHLTYRVIRIRRFVPSWSLTRRTIFVSTTDTWRAHGSYGKILKRLVVRSILV